MSFNTVDGNSWQNNPPAEDWPSFSYLGLPFVASPEQVSKRLPDLQADSTLLRTQPSSPTYPAAHQVPLPESFAVASPSPNAHGPFDSHDRPLQTDHQLPYYPPFFNPQDSGPMPTTHQRSATLRADCSLMRNDLQGYSSAVGPVPFHDPCYYPQDRSAPAQSHYNGFQSFVDQTQPSNPAMYTSYRQIQHEHALAGSSSFIPSELVLQPVGSRSPLAQAPPVPRNSRGRRSVTSSPYPAIWTPSSPVEPVSHKETVIHSCQWMKDDGTPCGGQITGATVTDHLITHGVKEMAHDHRLPCRWFGCQLRGNKPAMKRESIARHVRERHLGCRRPSKQV